MESSDLGWEEVATELFRKVSNDIYEKQSFS